MAMCVLMATAAGCGGDSGGEDDGGGRQEITAAQLQRVDEEVGSITPGSPEKGKQQVREILGEPEDTGSFTFPDGGTEDDCWFYSQRGPLLPGAGPDDKAVVCFNNFGTTQTSSSFAP
jgi:hypothetical protein